MAEMNVGAEKTEDKAEESKPCPHPHLKETLLLEEAGKPDWPAQGDDHEEAIGFIRDLCLFIIHKSFVSKITFLWQMRDEVETYRRSVVLVPTLLSRISAGDGPRTVWQSGQLARNR